jgi:hypothetical protein
MRIESGCKTRWILSSSFSFNKDKYNSLRCLETASIEYLSFTVLYKLLDRISICSGFSTNFLMNWYQSLLLLFTKYALPPSKNVFSSRFNAFTLAFTKSIWYGPKFWATKAFLWKPDSITYNCDLTLLNILSASGANEMSNKL